ncbi:hypothetical protein F4777DRAFT_569286 [Nemania sp. FL0916]|nr:hypothetical protein F4777DRAFT_569286 [Nemania sp. FL0916]
MAILFFLIFASATLVSCYPSTQPSHHLIRANLTDAPYGSNSCRCIPGDRCWPSLDDWASFNKTVKGRLISTVPVAHVCHAPQYDEAACSTIKATWTSPEAHIFAPGDFVAPYFQNQTCDPYTPTDKPCTLGNYPPYSVKVTGAEDIISSLKFVRKHNIRLVIKNTGQDFLGKSSGLGALELWTANMKSYSFIPKYKGNQYDGPAMKLGAGLINSEAALIAHKYNVRLVGGSSPSVGVAGGFTTGGGHSPLSGHYGLAADNVLEWEVVTPNGQHVVAKPQGEYADLYWAMTGGGGSTWGIVLSLTAKVHPDGVIGGAQLTVPSQGLTADAYWDAVAAYHRFVPTFASFGTVATTLLTNDTLTMFAATSPDVTAAQIKDQLSTFVGYLHEHKIPYTANYTEFDNYYDHLMHYLGPYPFGTFAITQLTGGQLISRALLQSETATENLVNTARSALRDGHFYIAMESFDLGATATAREAHHDGQNSVKSAWRESALYYIVIGGWDWTIPRDDMVARQRELSDVVMPALKAAAPGMGSYLNEGNFADPDWQESFYAENYPRLSRIKKHVDPDSLLYARTAVGSEHWREDSQGRLCFVR